ncbi:hypothetical protein [Microbacterium sp. 77mftsu3.1]|uniref:hypothetical protein n=1 Tax=Microbacterium sp. 77mftsu3.1 TaxID=1761802 RepID=UPI00115FAB9E|nr:hypothetical protein [Microbacterium sp. 77mftsu3.1]
MTDMNPAAEAARETHREKTTGRFGNQEHSAPELTIAAPSQPQKQWTPGEDVRIARETNPWLQVDGEPVDLTGIMLEGDHDCECYQLAGVLPGMDSPDGIQRCDACGRFEGDLDAAQHLATELTNLTGKEHTVWFEPAGIKESDPRYEPGVSDVDDDMTDEEWVEAFGEAPPGPFVFNGNYGDHEQVRPYMADYLAAFDQLKRPGFDTVYNDRFKGQIPSLAGTEDKAEDAAIYMLQNLRALDELEVTKAEFIASGGRKLDITELAEGETIRGTLVHAGFYMGGTGWAVREDVRVRRWVSPAGQDYVEYIEKGKRNGRRTLAKEGQFYFREGK